MVFLCASVSLWLVPVLSDPHSTDGTHHDFASDFSASQCGLSLAIEPSRLFGMQLDLHMRGIATAICYPLAILLYKWDPTVHDAPIDIFAKVMMWSGMILIAPLFIVPCLNQRRIRLLCYAIPIPIIAIMWIIGIPPGIR